jgi:hypothetical protein
MKDSMSGQNPEQKKIVWLASYPKSGNTWFRAFLTALLGDGNIDINKMEADCVFAARDIFDAATGMDSTLLYDSEVKNLLPDVFTHVASAYKKSRLFVKIHDAYTRIANGVAIVPERPTFCTLYFMRNPLDVATSFAHHSAKTVDQRIALMNDPHGVLTKSRKDSGEVNTKNWFEQLLLSWGGHVKSWTDNPEVPFPVLVVRYEDMLNTPFDTFSKAVKFIGLEKTPQEISSAIDASRFEKLKAQENEKGFAEKNRKSESFFRSGKSGGWKHELTAQQIQLLTDNHRELMEKYGYEVPNTALRIKSQETGAETKRLGQ